MPSPDVEYRGKLEKVVQQLKDSVALVEIWGDSAGQFIFANNGVRSLEISQCDEGIWLEFWDGEDESPTHELIVSSYDEATDAAVKWLNS